MAQGGCPKGEVARRQESGLAVSGVLAILLAASLFFLAVGGVAHRVTWHDLLLPGVSLDDGSTGEAGRN
jgi:hypothetical protein